MKLFTGQMLRLAIWLSAGLLAAWVMAQSAPVKPAPAATTDTQEFADPTTAFMHGLLTPQTLIERVGAVVLVILTCVIGYNLLMRGMRRAIRTAEAHAALLPENALQRHQRLMTVMSISTSLIRWGIGLLGFIWVLSAVGVNLLPVLTGVGFLGAAIAFGSQTLVRDLVSGFFILLEGQYAVGDWVDIGGKMGQVQAIGLRSTILKDTRNLMHHIPNGSIIACTVYPAGRVDWVLHVPLSNATDCAPVAQQLETMAQQAVRDLPGLLTASTPRIRQGDAGFSEVVLPFAIFPGQDWIASVELINRIKAILTAQEIPCPEGIPPHSEPERLNEIILDTIK